MKSSWSPVVSLFFLSALSILPICFHRNQWNFTASLSGTAKRHRFLWILNEFIPLSTSCPAQENMVDKLQPLLWSLCIFLYYGGKISFTYLFLFFYPTTLLPPTRFAHVQHDSTPTDYLWRGRKYIFFPPSRAVDNKFIFNPRFQNTSSTLNSWVFFYGREALSSTSDLTSASVEADYLEIAFWGETE